MQILFVPFWKWYPKAAHPAQGISVQEQVRAVAAFHRVAVLCCEPRSGGGMCWDTISDREEAGCRVIRLALRRIPLPGWTFLLYLWCLKDNFRRLRRLGFRPDIIHAHEYGAGAAAVILGREHGIPVVVSEHSSVFLRRRLSRRDMLKARFAFGRADTVLPVGEELATALRALGTGSRIEIIPNTIDTRVFRPGSAGPTARGGVKKILLPALLRNGKGIPGLLGALAELRRRRRDFILEIAGDGPKREEYRRLGDELGLTGTVRFSGMKNREELAGLMREAVFIVQPSELETFGMTVIEALASGKPVVARRIPAFERTISNRRGILVPPGDTRALTEALDHMLDHYSDYRPEVLARYVEENFSHRAVGERLNKVYTSAWARRPGGRSSFAGAG